MRTVEDRFWSKVNKTETCWLWTGSLSTNGHAQFWINGGKVQAHRWAYEQIVGPIPEGLVADHLCRVRACVNPAHIEPVTMRENTMRGISPVVAQSKVTHCPKGHPYAGKNLYVWRGHRKCNACMNSYDRKRKARGEGDR